MKCHKPGTDQKASVVVRAGDIECAEYVLPSASNSDPSVIERFISVEDGQEIQPFIDFSGFIHRGNIDIVADGNFVLARNFQNPTRPKHVNYSFHSLKLFRYTIGHEEDPKHELELPKVVVGNLRTKRLNEPFRNNSTSGFGIGSLAVVIYTAQRASDPSTKNVDYGEMTTLKNRLRGPDGGIKPTHQLEFTNVQDNLARQYQTQHLQHARNDRAGAKPIATIIFYYRSQDAINRAGCVLAPIDSHALPPLPGQRSLPTAANANAATASDVQQQNDRGSTVRFSESTKGGYGTTKKTVDKAAGKALGYPKPVNRGGAKPAAVDERKEGCTAMRPSTQSETPAAGQKKQLMGRTLFPGKSPSVGLSSLDISKGRTISPAGTSMGLRKPSSGKAPQSNAPKRRRPIPVAHTPSDDDDDHVSNDDADPPAPDTMESPRTTLPPSLPPFRAPKTRRPRTSAPSLFDTDDDHLGDHDAAPSPPKTASRSRLTSLDLIPPRCDPVRRGPRKYAPSLPIIDDDRVSNDGASSSQSSVDDDRLSDNDVGPAAPSTAERSRGPPPTLPSDASTLGKLTRGLSGRSQLAIESDRVSGGNTAPPAPTTDMRSRETLTARDARLGAENAALLRQIAQRRLAAESNRTSGDNATAAPPPRTHEGFFKRFARGASTKNPIEIGSDDDVSSEDDSEDLPLPPKSTNAQYGAATVPGMMGSTDRVHAPGASQGDAPRKRQRLDFGRPAEKGDGNEKKKKKHAYED